jgi:hypothetical protein
MRMSGTRPRPENTSGFYRNGLLRTRLGRRPVDLLEPEGEGHSGPPSVVGWEPDGQSHISGRRGPGAALLFSEPGPLRGYDGRKLGASGPSGQVS